MLLSSEEGLFLLVVVVDSKRKKKLKNENPSIKSEDTVGVIFESCQHLGLFCPSKRTPTLILNGGEGNPDLSGFSFRFLFQFCFWVSVWVSFEPQKPNSNPKTELKCQCYTNLGRFCTRKKLNLKSRIETQNQN
jgi:hypothetical protein